MDAVSQHNGTPYLPPIPEDLAGIKEELKRARAESRLIQERMHLQSLKRQESRARESWEGGGSWFGQPGSPEQGFQRDAGYRYGQADFAWFRRYGNNWPFWQTWVQHAMYRNQARVVWTISPNARGALDTICSYVIGESLLFRSASKKEMDAPKALIAAVQQQIDLFGEVNDFDAQQQEIFVRDRRDGESFTRDFHEPDEPLQLRILEPAEILEPPNYNPLTDSYGVINRLGDIYDVTGYFWAPDGDQQEGETIPADEVQHAKNLVDKRVKRGLSDLSFGTLTTLKATQGLIENMLDSGIDQSGIREIVQHAAATPQQVSAFRKGVSGGGPGGAAAVGGSNAPAGLPGPGGVNTFPGVPRRTKRLDIDAGQEYVVPPFTQNVEGYWSIVSGALRNVAVVWGAPEWIVNGDASNNNYASSVTAESPFVKRCLKYQCRYEKRFKKLVEKAVRHACDQGMVRALNRVWSWDEVRRVIEIQVEAPTVATRDLLKEAQTNSLRNQARVLSPQTWAQKDGLDYEQEQANFEEFQERTGGLGTQLPGADDEGGDGGGQDRPPHPSRESKDSTGHDHKGKGPGGGQFTGNGGGGGKKKEPTGGVSDKLSPMQAAAKEAVGKIKPTKKRAFEGRPTEGHVKLSKPLSGAIGEEIIIQHLKLKGFKDAQPFSTWLKSEQNNLPLDLIQDHEVIEAKTGQSSNGPGAQQWRLTIGEPGKEQKEWLKTASEEDKAKANLEKQEAIHTRKKEMIAHVTKELGKPIKGRTMTVILNPDTKTADLYSFEGFHDRIGWTSDAAKKAYIGSVTYGGK